ncbi:hypothetical protein INT46_001235 [Mucor plumbeus]|uniref:Uncharacterized protein n=1 Tax=Mucor plumbeus TaxID=97098 RepID=A0A8H7UXM3_9FUNG|nr:hypothetical protein INT46_001235 [Mucor plumbeus]
MPFILPQTDNCSTTITTIEKFNLLVEKYKHVIDNDPTARCMIGFTAATMIRNEGTVDLHSIESWLESVEKPNEQHMLSEECSSDDSVDKIMYVLTDTTMKYCNGDQEILPTNDECQEFVVDNQLNRYVSHNPYTSNESYPINVYVPNRIHVNHPLGNLFLPLESSC